MDPVLQAVQELQALQKSFVMDFQKYRDLASVEIKALGERQKVIEEAFKDRLIKQGRDQEQIPEKRWSWARVAYAVATKDWSVAPFEHQEIQKWREKATHLAGAPGLGGSLIPPQYIADLIGLLRATLIVNQIGTRIITGVTGSPILIPKLTGGITASWIGEGTSAPETNVTTGRLEMQPRKLAALAKISNDLNLLSNPGIEAAVQDDLVRGLSEAMETTFFTGAGVLGEPTGIKNSGITNYTTGTWTTSASADTAAEIVGNIGVLSGMAKQLENDKALRGKVAWVCNPTTFWALAALSDANARPFLLRESIANAPQTMLLGYPIYRSTLVAAAGTDTLYLANWDDTILMIWSEMSIVGSTETSSAFEKDELWIRAIMRADVGVRQVKSIVYRDDVD